MTGRPILFLLLLAVAILPVRSQQNFSSFSFGGSLPLGDFRGMNELPIQGFARPGTSIKFDGGYFPGSYLGIGASFSFSSHTVDADSLFSQIVRYVKQNVDFSALEGTEFDHETGFWNAISLFLGPLYSVRASQRLYLDFRVLAGPTVVRVPEQTLRFSTGGGQVYTRIQDEGIFFGTTGGAGFRYRINERVALKGGLDFFRVSSRSTARYEAFFEVLGAIPDLERKMTLQTLDFSLGLAYLLGS
ncbi:MAG: outer membrane beta-barrel protein [Bacteroidales bacterium]